MNDVIGALLGLCPVLVFLVVLILLDSYKLVSPRAVLQTIVAGCLVALICLRVNVWLMDSLSIDATAYRRYAAPVVEELLKSLYLIHLIRSKRAGFIVDAAIYGFAIGAGFALVENIYYLQSLPDSTLWLWIVRGFGTAILHGSTMALFGILSKGFVDRHDSLAFHFFLPGLLLALAIHSLYNQFAQHALVSTGILLTILPLLVLVVFEQSEKVTRNWLGVGFDTDTEMLELIMAGEISNTRVGNYLKSLKSKFPGTVVADMLCLLRIHLELSLRAKGILIAREFGVKVPIDEEIRANLKELKFLEKSVGKTGRLAMQPFLKTSSRDLWELYMLRS